METPKTLQAAIQHFSDYENCRKFMVAVRWLDEIIRCPRCNSEKVTYLAKARLYRCYGDHPKQKFSLKVGTVFEDSPIPLEKWLPAVWLIVNCKNGISSYELHRALGVTQKSAWFMLHRIRLAIQSKSFVKLGGPDSAPIEVDETFIGGKARNMHRSKRERLSRNGGMQGGSGKAVVMGMLERGGQVRTQVIPDRKHNITEKIVRELVETGTEVHTDEFQGYYNLKDGYEHKVINHLEGYVRENVHTNGIENFWSLLKRGLGGTYVSVEPFHLFRYVDEQAFRYNNRATKDNPLTDADRFQYALSQIVGKRLTFAEVTGKVGATPF
ncbi:MAG: IS1595 family transposase [Acidobacteria bacterium]|nr:MAG: IS1595 family transposase [Acidobacteriota bacterium]HEU0047227.1 IS1595 family transposase [Nitrososphaera sp.]